MKFQFLASLALVLAASSAFACGAHDEGDEHLENEIEAASKQLVCKTTKGLSEAKLNRYAIYRCINSPTYLRLDLTTEGGSVARIQKESEGNFKITTTDTQTRTMHYTEKAEKLGTVVYECTHNIDMTQTISKLADAECDREASWKARTKALSTYQDAKEAAGKSRMVDGEFQVELKRVTSNETHVEYEMANLTIEGNVLTGSGKLVMKRKGESCELESSSYTLSN